MLVFRLMILIISLCPLVAGAESKVYIERSTDRIVKLLDEVPELREYYDACQKHIAENPDSTTLESCLTDGVVDTEIVAVPPEIVEKMSAKMSEGKETSYDSMDISNVDSNTDPGVKAFQDYLYEKLQKTLYGEGKEKEKVGHNVFYELYESKAGKNVIETISSYCIEADSGKGYLIPESDSEREKIRKKNLENLSKTAAASTEDKDNSGDTSQMTSLAYQNWGKCMDSLQHICHGTQGTYFEYEADDSSVSVYRIAMDKNDKMVRDPATPISGSSGWFSDYKHSKRKACLATNYLKALRQNLLAVRDIKSQLAGTPGDPTPIALIEGRKEAVDINQATTISSNELVNTSGYKDANKQKLDELDQCLKEKDPELCKKFLISKEDKAKLEEAIAEQRMRIEAMNSKLRSDEMSEEDVRNYLADEGRSQDEIEEIMKGITDPESLKSLKERIADNYEKEKLAVIAELREQVDGKSSSEDVVDLEKDEATLKQIQKELSEQTRRQQELTHFNNIVSGYIGITDSNTKEKSRNTISIETELTDSAYNKDNQSAEEGPVAENVYGSSEDTLEKLEETIDEQGVRESSSQNTDGTTTLDVDTMNEKMLKTDF